MPRGVRERHGSVEALEGAGSLRGAGDLGIGETEEMMAVVTQLRRLPDDFTGLAHDLVTTEIAHRLEYVGPPGRPST